MKKARVLVSNRYAGDLIGEGDGRYVFEYAPDYNGPPVSLTMPLSQRRYEYNGFPAFFDGLLPEGRRLEALLRIAKLDASDYFGQLVAVGEDLVGAVTVRPSEHP